MGLDPLTIGLITAGIGTAASSVGQWRGQNAQNKQQKTVNDKASGMMAEGANPYEALFQQLFAGAGQGINLDPNSGQIDVQSILARMNPGQDALAQFLRADPTGSLVGFADGSFDASKAFGMLAADDDRRVNQAAASLRSGYAGLGQRFGGAAQRQEGMLRSDFAAQIGARNAGIAQGSYEQAAARKLAAATSGMGLRLGGAQALSSAGVSAAQIAAGLGQANQNNLFRNNQFNLDSSNMNFMQKLQALQGGFGVQQTQFGNNRDLLAIMAGLQPGGGAGWSAAGQGLGDIGQLLAFLPLLQQMGGARTTPGAAPTPASRGGGYF